MKTLGPQTPQKKKDISNKEFIDLLDANNDIREAFWGYSDVNASRNLKIFNSDPTKPEPQWMKDYEIASVRKKFLAISAQMQIISTFRHGLGLEDYFPTHPKHQFGKTVNQIVNAEFPNTLFSVFYKWEPRHAFIEGYYNLAFQVSLLDSLKAFAVSKRFTDVESSILTTCIKYFEESITYYQTFAKTGTMPRKHIYQDLINGRTRLFSTGRAPKLHATNIIMSKNTVLFCDRYDVDVSVFKDFISGYTPTGRNPEDGVYAYKLPKPFSSLEKSIQDKLIDWLTISITFKESLFSIKDVLGLSTYPAYTLEALTQTKGNCRRTSKKQGVGGLMLSVALELVEQGVLKMTTKEMLKMVQRLHKSYKLFDRLHQIYKLISSKIMPESSKAQLLLLALIRNADPKKPLNGMDLAIAQKIGSYFQSYITSPMIQDIFTVFFENLEKNLKDKDEQEHLQIVVKRFTQITKCHNMPQKGRSNPTKKEPFARNYDGCQTTKNTAPLLFRQEAARLLKEERRRRMTTTTKKIRVLQREELINRKKELARSFYGK